MYAVLLALGRCALRWPVARRALAEPPPEWLASTVLAGTGLCVYASTDTDSS
jgi:hypothetical protein